MVKRGEGSEAKNSGLQKVVLKIFETTKTDGKRTC